MNPDGNTSVMCSKFQINWYIDESGFKFTCYGTSEKKVCRYALYAFCHEFNTTTMPWGIVDQTIQWKWFRFFSPFCPILKSQPMNICTSQNTTVPLCHTYDNYHSHGIRRPKGLKLLHYSHCDCEYVILTNVLLSLLFFLSSFIHSFIYLFYFSSPFYFCILS